MGEGRRDCERKEWGMRKGLRLSENEWEMRKMENALLKNGNANR